MKTSMLKASSALRQRLSRRHLAWSAAVGVVLALGYNAALPLIVTRTDARATMERLLDSWSGGKSRISGEPQIRFWPEPLVILPSTAIMSTGAQPRPLAEIGRITASFSLLSAIRGEPALEDVTLIDPVITIERLADGTTNWQLPHWLARPTPGMDNAVGGIAIENGRLKLRDALSGNSTDVAGIAGTVKWPSYAERLSAQFSTVLAGQEVGWAFVCDDPLAFFARRNAPVKTSITSIPLTFSFEGTGNLLLTPFASGHLQLSVPSLAALATWLGEAKDTGLPPGALSIDAKVATGEDILKLDDLQLTVGGAIATGVLDIALPKGKEPQIGGTLAFDRIDLNGLSISMPPPIDRSGRLLQLFENFVSRWRTDVRLSAQEVLVGSLHVTDLAAGVIINGNRASLDIGDSTYAGGSLSGRAALSEKGLEHGGRLQLSLRNADFATVLGGFGLKGPMPDGKGLLNLDIGTDRPLWDAGLGDASGRIRYSLTNGSLVGFDVHAFNDLLHKGEFFSLSEASEATFDFQAADIEASFADGTARLDRADLVSPSGNISLAGIIPYRNGSLALAGTLKDAAADDGKPLRFFVGGSWPNAVISPLSMLVGPK
ncbi:AsmA protein [Sinorhizobium kostiense]|uniref:AsmA protein n=1 Tax=Sinorhizobium kostiense TaxID=76747 RepID=A0ABS4QY67_9HYPH|nr:AsmA family protein [Sinorhizobium kostiense]MBP2235585.1 AsmA protein [Sinorhizobium kostiense]